MLRRSFEGPSDDTVLLHVENARIHLVAVSMTRLAAEPEFRDYDHLHGAALRSALAISRLHV